MLQRGKVQVIQTASRLPRRITLKPGDLVSLDSAGSRSMKHVTHPDAYAKLTGLEGELYSSHFGSLRTDGMQVYLTGLTPFTHTLTTG